jgi:hypothetical protein
VGSGGNGVLAGPYDGFNGQVAYVGFTAPAATNDVLNLFRPVGLTPVGGSLPLVTFRVTFQIFDPTTAAPHFDEFRWSAYDTADRRLFSLHFPLHPDELRQLIEFSLPGDTVPRTTNFRFLTGEVYDLTITMNFARRLWTADINGAVIVNAAALGEPGRALDLNTVDAVWYVPTPGSPGDNFMVFDDYRLTALPLADIPPTLEAVGRLTDGTFLIRVLGEPGLRYTVEASPDFVTWAPIATGDAQSPSGFFDVQDLGARTRPAQFYRAYSVP